MHGSRKHRWQVLVAFFFLIAGFYLWFKTDGKFSHQKRFSGTSRKTSMTSASFDFLLSNQTYFEWLVEQSSKTNTSTPCSPKDKVMFLKTHKTGSSTVTNILNRYGNKKDLVIALPKGESTFDWPRRLRTDRIVNTWPIQPHILCNHARYNKQIMHHLFPKSTSTYITILREPLSHYESVFNYFELWKGLGIEGKNSLEILKKYLLQVSSVKSAKLNLKDRSRLLRNPQIYDLGLDFRYYQDAMAVKKYIEFLEKEYDLVMIMEYFDESAVLLKRLMCWEMDDVIFIKHNERQKKDKKTFSPMLQANIKSWNQADFMLYDHFNKTLWKKIAAEGPDFYEDLARFRKRKQEVFHMCVGPNTVVTEIYHGKYVQGHSLKKDIPNDKKLFCSNLVKSELTFHNENVAKQQKRQAQIDDPGEFKDEFDKENDWDKAKDFEYHPVREIQ